MQVNEIMTIMQRLAPKKLAENWDNTGLLVGSTTKQVNRILITLDVTTEVVKEAIEKKIDLIIAHHPVIFKGIKAITNQTTQGKLLIDLIKHDISVYVAHTNLDSAHNGMNDWLANQLKLTNIQVLVPTYHETMYQFTTYIPHPSFEAVKQALFDAGAGQIGEYTECGFSSKGIGQFKGNLASHPVIGQTNKVEYVEEVKLEVQVSQTHLSAVISALEQTHPYETPVYQIVALTQQTNIQGLGKIGDLPQKITLLEMAKQCKQVFNTPMVKMIGPSNKIVEKVAIVGGAGRDFIQQAKAQHADVYITGDVTYHAALDALDLDMAMIDAGHYIEHIIKSQLSQILEQELSDEEIDIIESAINTNPYKYIMS